MGLKPPFGGLGSTYTIYIGLIEKRVVDFLLVLIELFSRCYDWGPTSENRLKIGVLQGVGSVSANFYVEGINVPTNHFRTDR